MKKEITIKAEITPKYKIGACVFFMRNDFIRKGEIITITKRIYKVNLCEFTEVMYEVSFEVGSGQHKCKFTATLKEMFLYESLDEIITHLKDNVI